MFLHSFKLLFKYFKFNQIVELTILALLGAITELTLLYSLGELLSGDDTKARFLLVSALLFWVSQFVMNRRILGIISSIVVNIGNSLTKYNILNYLNRSQDLNKENVIHDLTNKLNRLQGSVFYPFVLIYSKALFFLVLLILMVLDHGFVVVYFLIGVILLSLLVIFIIKPVYKKLGDNHIENLSQVISSIDFFDNLKERLVSGKWSNDVGTLTTNHKKLYDNQASLLFTPIVLKTTVELVLYSLLALFMLFSGNDIAGVISYGFIFIRSLPALQIIWGGIGNIQGGLSILVDVSDRIKKTKEIEITPLLRSVGNNWHIDRFKIDFEGFSLTMQAADISNNDKILVRGNSGSGKTTLVDTLLGLSVLMGGKGEIGVTSSKYGGLSLEYSKQLVSIFSGSILENLNPSPTNIERVNDVLESLGLREVINKAGGIDAYIGPNSAPFSGGQLKRFSIAKSLLQDAELYVFDEPDQGLDDVSRVLVFNAIQKLDKPVFVISHHPEGFEEIFTKVFKVSDGEVNVCENEGN